MTTQLAFSLHNPVQRTMVPSLADDEIIVDSFAGGGGASTGIEMALGRSPDIAINHDAEAITLHKANHPDTEHYIESVWRVDPIAAVERIAQKRGRPVRVGLMWASPDCRHFSKAKGGKPVSKKIRGLAWVAVRWAAAVRPRVIVLENVEEFQDWGPVLPNGMPCPKRAGKTFRAFVGKLKRLGYVVEWRQLRASHYNTPTIRKRLFLIARCDGQPIVWPEPTNGPKAGVPERAAAECIEWGLPCPSIFGRKKPLAENTLRRIRRGIERYVINNPKPFIVGVGGRMGQSPEKSVEQPMNTITSKGDSAIVMPHITKFRANSVGSDITEPMHTITSNGSGSANSDRPGCAIPLGLVEATAVPYIIPTAHQGDARCYSVEEPITTICGGKRGDQAMVAPFLKPRYGEREGQEPRVRSVEEPMPVVVPTQNGGDLVTAFMAQHNTGVVGHSMTEPVSTIIGKGCTQALVASHITKLYGTSQDGQPMDAPLATVTGSGQHLAETRAFLVSFYGTDQDSGNVLNPIPTVTSKDRFALITVNGVQYEIVDIGMRMLQPRELYRAQGFPESYKIEVPHDYVVTKKVKGKKVKKVIRKILTKTAQVRMCGNSVCPPMARAIIAANYANTTASTKERVA